MANKAMWDWMDKAEGRKDSSYDNMEKEKERQGVKKPIKAKKNKTTGKLTMKVKKKMSDMPAGKGSGDASLPFTKNFMKNAENKEKE